MTFSWGFDLVIKLEEEEGFGQKFLDAIKKYIAEGYESRPVCRWESCRDILIEFPAPNRKGTEIIPFDLREVFAVGKYVILKFDASGVAINRANDELVIKIFFDVCRQLDPVAGFLSSDFGYLETIAESPVEYYRDPYWYCFLPEVNEHIYPTFLHEDKIAEMEKKLSEIRKVLSVDELVELLQQHCERVVRGGTGIGISKHDGTEKKAVVIPRYFLRQEARRRGVQLDEGLAEKYARKYGVK